MGHQVRTDPDTACRSAPERSSRSAAKAPSAGPRRPMRWPASCPPRVSTVPSWRTAIRRRTAPEPDSGKRLSTLHLPLCQRVGEWAVGVVGRRTCTPIVRAILLDYFKELFVHRFCPLERGGFRCTSVSVGLEAVDGDSAILERHWYR